MRRLLLPLVGVVVAAAALYLLVIRDRTVEPTVRAPVQVAAIGVGSSAVAVDASGKVLSSLPAPEEGSLPLLPISEPPKSGRLRGPALEQVRVLAAAPAGLRPYLASTSFREEGVIVELGPGIEIQFGDASQAKLKWRSAAAVLADPATESADYVNVQAPHRPSVGGSGHILPPVE